MIEVTKKIPVLLLLLCLVSCNAFDYSPYDGRVTGETGINEKNIALS